MLSAAWGRNCVSHMLYVNFVSTFEVRNVRTKTQLPWNGSKRAEQTNQRFSGRKNPNNVVINSISSVNILWRFSLYKVTFGFYTIYLIEWKKWSWYHVNSLISFWLIFFYSCVTSLLSFIRDKPNFFHSSTEFLNRCSTPSLTHNCILIGV